MEVKKCKKCGIFYNTGENYCATCNIKMDKVKNIIGEYILEESLNEFDISFDEMYLGLDEMKKEISNIPKRDLYLGFIDLKDERN